MQPPSQDHFIHSRILDLSKMRYHFPLRRVFPDIPIDPALLSLSPSQPLSSPNHIHEPEYSHSEREWPEDARFQWNDPRHLWLDHQTYESEQQGNMIRLLLEAPWDTSYTATPFATTRLHTEKWVFRSSDGTAFNGTWTRHSGAGLLCELNSMVHSSTDICLQLPESDWPSDKPSSVATIGMSSLPGQRARASDILTIDGNEANRAYLMLCTLSGFQQQPTAFSTPGSIYGANISLPVRNQATGALRFFTLTTSPKPGNQGRQGWSFSLFEVSTSPNGRTQHNLRVMGTSDSESGMTVVFHYDKGPNSTMSGSRNGLDVLGEMSFIHFLLLCMKDQKYRVDNAVSAT